MGCSRRMPACSTIGSGAACPTHRAPPPKTSWPLPLLLFPRSPNCQPRPFRPCPASALPTLSSDPAPLRQALPFSPPGPAQPRPLRTWLPRGLAGGQGSQRCSEPSSDWPGPARGGGQRWEGRVGSTCPAHGRKERWVPTWAKGVTITSSPCLRGDQTWKGGQREPSHTFPSSSFFWVFFFSFFAPRGMRDLSY